MKRIIIPLGLLGMVVLLGVMTLSRAGPPVSASDTLVLQPPPAPALSGAAFLEDEAGFTAYTFVSQTIQINSIRGAFRTIEAETADYMIGSVPVPGYDINFDAHVYVHTSGWIVAYYSPARAVSFVYDFKNRSIGRTNLDEVLEYVAGQDYLIVPWVAYYDFRYPNATRIMFIHKINGGAFQVNIPAPFGFYERSWALTGWCDSYTPCSLSLKLNGATLGSSTNVSGWRSMYGVLSNDQLIPDYLHTFTLSAKSIDYPSALLVLVYRDPNATP